MNPSRFPTSVTQVLEVHEVLNLLEVLEEKMLYKQHIVQCSSSAAGSPQAQAGSPQVSHKSPTTSLPPIVTSTEST